MEQFEYQRACEAFEEAVKLAPDWTPAKINLGIALLNRGKDGHRTGQGLALFKQVLDKNPDDPHRTTAPGSSITTAASDAARPHFEAVTRIDPNDAHAWYYRGMSILDHDDSKEAYGYFNKASS